MSIGSIYGWLCDTNNSLPSSSGWDIDFKTCHDSQVDLLVTRYLVIQSMLVNIILQHVLKSQRKRGFFFCFFFMFVEWNLGFSKVLFFGMVFVFYFQIVRKICGTHIKIIDLVSTYIFAYTSILYEIPGL